MDLTKLKRFTTEQHDQLRQLLAWCELMGLSGKDLVSLGGKIERIQEQQEREANAEIVKNFGFIAIGDDAKLPKASRENAMDERFKIRTAAGAYNFVWERGNWRVSSLSTGVKKHISLVTSPYEYKLSKSLGWRRRHRYAIALDIHNGHIQLNF